MTFGNRVLHSVWTGASRAAAWPFRVAATRATLRALGRMDRRELADIGLNPCDISDIAALPLDRDPTALLAARACERRVNAPSTAWGGDWSDEDPRESSRPNRPSPRPGSPRTRVLKTG